MFLFIFARPVAFIHMGNISFRFKIFNEMVSPRSLWILCSLVLLSFGLYAQNRTSYLLDRNWKFTRDDDSATIDPAYDDSKWQRVSIPHDWAICGPFSEFNDLQKVAITQDGQKEAQSHAGRTGGLPFVGIGWYRTSFEAPAFAKGKMATIIFDGAMSNARVYLNGRHVGYWPYGYNSFHFDITDYLLPGKNVLAVRLENYPESSRWYPGAGIYRNVHLQVTEEAHIPLWGTYITTPVVNKEFAKVHAQTKVSRPANSGTTDYSLITEISNSQGQVVATSESALRDADHGEFNQELIVKDPELWDIENPALYSLLSKLYYKGKQVDEYSTRIGIRSIEIIADKGFFLNGKRTKFQGVCMHHDLGPLGAAVNDAAIRRQLRILKDMGVNAIRTSHNMPAPELIRACDEMGLMVMAESFDEWKYPKVKNGYNRYFDQWAEKDLVNLIHQFRNNPSVVMWCIGNEVPEQGIPGGSKIARYLQDICHREDPTRFVTQGMDQPDAVLNNNFAAVMEVAGFNYRPFKYVEAYKKLPQELVLGSETASTISSRGIYKFPVERKSMAKYDDHQASSYDVEHCSWSDLPEDNFIQNEDLPFSMGEFVWTGFDYLGEPTPYYEDWPSHSSLFGIVDLAGIPKDRYYLYRSHWNKKESTLHILPHWNWKGREGEITPVFVYTSYPAAELFINGKSQGIRKKDTSISVHDSGDKASLESLKRQKRYRLMWMETRYEPGTIKVVAYDSTGTAAEEKEIHTAGKPYHIELTADRKEIAADGKDLSFINVKVVDKDGNFCPEESREIHFTVKGNGKYLAAANGNPASLESFQAPRMELFSGQLTAIVQSSDKAGTISFEASAKGLKAAKILIRTN